MGHIERNLAIQAMRSGEPIPDRIANAPELKLGLALFLQAFLDLDSERSNDGGLNRIPWSSIKQYAEFNEFDDEQTELLFYHIRFLDAEHLKKLEAKRKAVQNSNSSKGVKKRGR